MKVRRFLTSMTRISDLAIEPYDVEALPRTSWDTGDYVVVETTSRESERTVELTTGRMIELVEGDVVVGALGRRHATLEATGTWEAVGEDGTMQVLTGGGLLGRCTSKSALMPEMPDVRYLGHVQRSGRKVRMKDFVPEPPTRAPFRVPTVLIIGTSMSAGKTTTGRVLVRRLKAMGSTVLAAKVTGAGRSRDMLTMVDAGADAAFDFVDVGLPSTVCPEDEYRDALGILLMMMAGAGADVAVVEVGASPLEPYNGAIAVEALAPSVRMTVLCATDPYAVVGVRHAFGAEPDLVTGVASNTLAGVELVENLTGIPCVNVRNRDALPRLDGMLVERLGLSRGGSAAPNP